MWRPGRGIARCGSWCVLNLFGDVVMVDLYVIIVSDLLYLLAESTNKFYLMIIPFIDLRCELLVIQITYVGILPRTYGRWLRQLIKPK